jgi:hypothetical protein
MVSVVVSSAVSSDGTATSSLAAVATVRPSGSTRLATARTRTGAASVERAVTVTGTRQASPPSWRGSHCTPSVSIDTGARRASQAWRYRPAPSYHQPSIASASTRIATTFSASPNRANGVMSR